MNVVLNLLVLFIWMLFITRISKRLIKQKINKEQNKDQNIIF
jgi:hypothetical protein